MRTDSSPYSPPQSSIATPHPKPSPRSFTLVPSIVFFALLIAGGHASSYAYRHGVLWTSSASLSTPPWYFLGKDLIDAISYSIALSIFLVFVFLTRERYGHTYTSTVPLAFIFMGNHVFDGIVVLIRTDNIMDPKVASSHWQSLPAYLNDPLRSWGLPIVFAIALASGLLLKLWVHVPQDQVEVSEKEEASPVNQ